MDTSWSAAPKFLASPVPGCAHADLGKPAALAMTGKQRLSQTRRGLAGFRCAAMAAGTELTKDIRQIPGRSVVPCRPVLSVSAGTCQHLMPRQSGEPSAGGRGTIVTTEGGP
jgi:hypothetical protein